MFLRYRPATLRDLSECQYCLRDQFAYDEQALPKLVAFWRKLLLDQSGHAAVIEDITAPPGQGIVWFCFKVFASDQQVDRYFRTAAPPLLGRGLLERHLAGAKMPILTGEERRRDSSPDGPGVNLVVLNSGFPARVLEEPGMLEIMGDKVADFNTYFCAGYKLNGLWMELYNDFQYDWARGAGYRLTTDYADYYQREKAGFPPEGQRPQLWGATAAEALARRGTVAAMVFKYQPPRFYFRPIEQELLLWAMANATDTELAEALNLSPNTLKKRWRGIYERVDERSSLFAHLREFSPEKPGDRERGGEKRRYLLNYLKHHHEELRLAEPPADSGRAT